MISYGLYLYHYIIFVLLDEYGGRFGLTGRIALDSARLALSFGVAILSWKFIERPLLARKDSFAYTRGVVPVPNFASASSRIESMKCDA
jgi:peptidoglycan/LPS O-acetylase OafA/YrhL